MVRMRCGVLARCFCLLVWAIALCGCHAFTGAMKQEITTTPSIALALPSSGPYATVAARIKRGAKAGVAELAGRGIHVQMVDVDTSKSNWLQQVAQLPPACAVVGGPLGEGNYLAARKAGLLNSRMFFPFMPTLAHGDEGKLAYRFFPSPQDQVDALVNCATDQLNIRSVGAFYPDDAYGRHMTALLEKSLAGKHITLRKASYNAKTPASWKAAIRPLVNPAPGATYTPHTDFEALFVPDSWKNLNNVLAALRDNGEERLILLGTTLWEQGMKGKGPGRMTLGIFPVAWTRANMPKALQGTGDFWTALGYDFVKFAGLLGLAAKPESNVMAVDRIQKAALGITALAPMRWDSDGVAHQNLKIFQMSDQGVGPLNVNGFRQSRQAMAERAALREQAAREREAAREAQEEETDHEESPASASPTPAPEATSPPEPAPAQAQLPGIEAVPHTSYKLSLPVKR